VDKETTPEFTAIENEENSNAIPKKSKKGQIAVLLVCAVGVITIFFAYTLLNVDYNGTQSITDNDDTTFENWVVSSMSVLMTDGDGIATATENYDFSSLEYWFNKLKNDANRYKNQINSYSVSSEWQTTQIYYKLALDDYYWAGYYGEIGIKNMDNDYLTDGYDYLDKGTAHIHTLNDLRNQTSSWQEVDSFNLSSHTKQHILSVPSDAHWKLSWVKYSGGNLDATIYLDSTLNQVFDIIYTYEDGEKEFAESSNMTLYLRLNSEGTWHFTLWILS
jgi:hypothetical protein